MYTCHTINQKQLKRITLSCLLIYIYKDLLYSHLLFYVLTGKNNLMAVLEAWGDGISHHLSVHPGYLLGAIGTRPIPSLRQGSGLSSACVSSDPQGAHIFLFIILLIYLFSSVLGLPCCSCFSLFVESGGRGLLQAEASAVAELGLQDARASVLAVPGLKCSAVHRIFLDQGSNLCLLHWQADSLPLTHQGHPKALSHCRLSNLKNKLPRDHALQMHRPWKRARRALRSCEMNGWHQHQYAPDVCFHYHFPKWFCIYTQILSY